MIRNGTGLFENRTGDALTLTGKLILSVEINSYGVYRPKDSGVIETPLTCPGLTVLILLLEPITLSKIVGIKPNSVIRW